MVARPRGAVARFLQNGGETLGAGNRVEHVHGLGLRLFGRSIGERRVCPDLGMTEEPGLRERAERT
jgi:hypothetical protein